MLISKELPEIHLRVPDDDINLAISPLILLDYFADPSSTPPLLQLSDILLHKNNIILANHKSGKSFSTHITEFDSFQNYNCRIQGTNCFFFNDNDKEVTIFTFVDQNLFDEILCLNEDIKGEVGSDGEGNDDIEDCDDIMAQLDLAVDDVLEEGQKLKSFIKIQKAVLPSTKQNSIFLQPPWESFKNTTFTTISSEIVTSTPVDFTITNLCRNKKITDIGFIETFKFTTCETSPISLFAFCSWFGYIATFSSSKSTLEIIKISSATLVFKEKIENNNAILTIDFLLLPSPDSDEDVLTLLAGFEDGSVFAYEVDTAVENVFKTRVFEVVDRKSSRIFSIFQFEKQWLIVVLNNSVHALKFDGTRWKIGYTLNSGDEGILKGFEVGVSGLPYLVLATTASLSKKSELSLKFVQLPKLTVESDVIIHLGDDLEIGSIEIQNMMISTNSSKLFIKIGTIVKIFSFEIEVEQSTYISRHVPYTPTPPANKREEVQNSSKSAGEVMGRNRELLEERGERLQIIAKNSEKLSEAGSLFLQNAKKLNEKQANKKWWQF